MIGNTYRKGLRPANAFAVGHSTWNKGVKGIRVSPHSEFRKGDRPVNFVPIGTVRVRIDKNGKPRAFVKVDNPRTWKLRAVVAWEVVFGSVPKGCVIHHKDRNPLNDSIQNLACLTRTDHIAEHRSELYSVK